MTAHICFQLDYHMSATYDHISRYMIDTYMILCSYMTHIYEYTDI